MRFAGHQITKNEKKIIEEKDIKIIEGEGR